MGAAEEEIGVLHVDDAPDFTELVRDVLEDEDEQFAIETATTVERGLGIVADRAPDCIISDYDLPGRGGIEFLEAVREQYPDLPFILYTGRGSEKVASEAISAGVTDYLRKETGTEQFHLLATRIRNLVRKYRLEQTAERREERLKLFFDESPLGAIQWDEEFRFQRLNERAEEILRYEEAEIRGEPWEVIVDDDDHSRVEDAVSDLLDADGGRHVINRNVRKDGEVRTVEWHNRAVTNEDGEVRSIFSKFQDITDRENRKRELEEHETIIDALTDAVYVIDEDGRFTYVNDEFVELTGYDRETIVGNTPSLIKTDDAVERAERALGRLLSSGGPETITFEVTLQPRDGEPIICEDHMGVLPYDGDDFGGSVGTLRDITEEKERKRQLQEERDRFRSVFNDAFDAIVIIGDDRRYIDVNEQATELFGLTREELIGKSIDTSAPGSSNFEEAWQEIQTSKRDRGTARISRPNGTERLVEYAASADIVPGQHLVILRDVTDHRRRERRFQALVEESSDVISVVDDSGRFQYQSPSLERILGYDPGEVIGDTVWEYIHPADRDAVREEFEAWVEGPKSAPAGIQYRVRHADGYWRWMEGYGNCQVDNPAVSGYVVNSRDITERKERQQQLKILDRVLRHNLRNDMNVIRGAAETIRSDAAAKGADSAEQIIETSDRLIRTAEKERRIADLLQESPSPKEIAVKPVLQRVAADVRAEHPDAMLAVECPEGASAQATRQLERAIRELVTNAIVHNGSESPEVAVSVVQRGEALRIEVADRGPSIPEMERDILLGNEERTSLYHGSGFGLWLVQVVISRSGGSVTFEQNDPTGNVVILELPS
ncbi:MAG: PAS domain S-box protein [Halobellus sp.]|uniref:PAS domain S-box protein n=1 Tax=Halobellus sp. TaxID=1979212 RepID=UPI0035D43F4E